ncbi:hypothetical protein C0989_005287, partial [Termitomyces sp. Mn162]
GGVAIKKFEKDWSGEALEVLGSKHCQEFVNEVIGGTTVDQCGGKVIGEGEGGAKEEDVGGVGRKMGWEVVWGKYHCMEECDQSGEDVGVWSVV